MMGWKTEYDVEFKGLKEGRHEFNFESGDKFFEYFEQNLVTSAKVAINVELEKRSTFLKLHFELKGWVELACDRCLENYRQKLKHKAEVFVKFSDIQQEDDIDVMWVLPEEHRINLAQLIYEFIMLSIPLKKVHPTNKKGESECNDVMLERLDKYIQQYFDEKQQTDPRWDELKKLRKQ
jgi:uncharacterized metal-binding protein YceD (DUF177 family)